LGGEGARERGWAFWRGQPFAAEVLDAKGGGGRRVPFRKGGKREPSGREGEKRVPTIIVLRLLRGKKPGRRGGKIAGP